MRTSKSLAWAALAGVVASWISYQALAPTGAPMWLARLTAGGDLDEMAYRGGIRVSYRIKESLAGPDDARAVARVLARRARAVGTVVAVSMRETEIAMTIAGVSEGDADTVARHLMRRGQLRFHRVVAGAEVMRGLYARAAAGGAVRGELDFHVSEGSGQTHRDWYLMAASRADLEAFIAAAASDDLRLAAEPGRAFAFEPVPVVGPVGTRDEEWRTYYVDSAPVIENRDIESAVATEDSMTGAPVVVLHFSARGGQRWAAFTAASVGDKVAIVLDDTVLSAPVIQQPIRGGMAMISLGREQSMAEARILASSLMAAESGGPGLEWTLAITALDYVPPRVTEHQLGVARVEYALLLGVMVLGLVFLVDSLVEHLNSRRALVPGASARTGAGRGAPAAQTWPVVPLLVSLGAAVAVYFFAELPLPGVASERAAMLSAGAGDSGQAVHFSVFALGILPIVSAFLMVELAALLVPAWRPLRHGGPEARARLGKVALIVSLVLALVQGHMIARWLNNLGWGVVPEPGMRFVGVATLTLAAGVMVYWIVAALVSRHGIGNGFALIIAAGVLGHLRMLYPMVEHLDLGSVDMAWLVFGVAAVVMATSALVRVPLAGLSLPTCGIVPLIYAAGLIAMAQILALAGWLGPLSLAMDLGPGGTHLATVIALAVALSWLFSRPPGAARLAGLASPLLFWAAVALSAAFLVGVGVLDMAAPDSVTALLSLPSIIMATAIGTDFVAEWRAWRRHGDLVPVWPLHRVQATDTMLAALRGAGIDACARGRYFRALFHFFAPFVAIEILVPSARAEQAREILRDL